ncbi:MAG TPA: L,D-transpeptidase [Gaiellaceae bacterium]|nr:L,D-transpeptidase [Gaiellaceae bacterium]
MLKRAGLVLCVALVCALGAGAVSARADGTPPPTETTPVATIAAGIVLGPVAVGGMTAGRAIGAVTRAYARPVVLRVGATTVTASPARFRTSVPAEAAVAKALTVAPGTVLGLRAEIDRTLVRSWVAKLARRLDRKAVDSRLLLRHLKPYVTRSRSGLVVRQTATAAALASALVHGTRAPIAVPTKTLLPKLTPPGIGPVIVISRGENRLSLYDGRTLVRTFGVATGQTTYPTPLGRFQIVAKWRDPWWYPPNSPWAKGEKAVPPGPGNPLGTRWMGISSPGVGIHGTPEDGSIGYSVSHGCIRMHIPQAEWLFDHVTVGTPVWIVRA